MKHTKLLNKPETHNNLIFVYHGGDHIYKKWMKTRLIYKRLLEKIELIQKVDPTYILDHGEEKDYVWAKMQIINGKKGFGRKWDDLFVTRIVNFIINHYETFYPIYHGDPTLGNIIITKEDKLHFIDYDQIHICEDKKTVFDHMQEKCLESFFEYSNKDIIKELLNGN